MAPEACACLHQAEQARAGTGTDLDQRWTFHFAFWGMPWPCRLEMGDQPPISAEPTEGYGRWPSMCDGQGLTAGAHGLYSV